MQRILRPLLLVAVLAALAGLSACGGNDAADQDVNTLLKETFSGQQKMESGVLSLDLEVDLRGGQAQGPVKAQLRGPFQSEGANRLPRFDLELTVDGVGTSFKAGASSTGDKAFVLWQGQEYAVSEQLYRQIRETYERVAAENARESRGASLQTLGLDPRSWLRNPRNEGESKVGDTDTVRITGTVDVPKLLDDLNGALERAGQLGAAGGRQLPTKLTDEQKRQVAESVRDVRVEIHTGADDKVLRRILLTMDLTAPQQAGGGSAGVRLDYSIRDLNEDQEIEAPANAKPLEELLRGLDLGALGGALGGGAGAGSSSGSGGSGAGSGAASQEDLRKFTECLERAGEDEQKAADCSKLISP